MPRLAALTLIAMACLPAISQAQVYKCAGNVYQSSPCPEGKVLDLSHAGKGDATTRPSIVDQAHALDARKAAERKAELTRRASAAEAAFHRAARAADARQRYLQEENNALLRQLAIGVNNATQRGVQYNTGNGYPKHAKRR
jgi:hypothetical protein